MSTAELFEAVVAREAVLIEEIEALQRKIAARRSLQAAQGGRRVKFTPHPAEIPETPERRGPFQWPARSNKLGSTAAGDEAALLQEISGMLQAMPTGALAMLASRIGGGT